MNGDQKVIGWEKHLVWPLHGWIHQSKRKSNYSQDQDAPTVGSDLDEVLFDTDKEFDNILSENAVMEFLKDMD